MVKKKDMNWLQRLLYGCRWRKYSKQCDECGGCGEDKAQPEESCLWCDGTGMQHFYEANCGGFDAGMQESGWRVEVFGVFYSPSLPTEH